MLSNNCWLPGARLVSQSAALELTITYHPVGEAAYSFAASSNADLVRESGGSARPTDGQLAHTESTVGFEVPPTRRWHHHIDEYTCLFVKRVCVIRDRDV